jgi:hypothetical protein
MGKKPIRLSTLLPTYADKHSNSLNYTLENSTINLRRTREILLRKFSYRTQYSRRSLNRPSAILTPLGLQNDDSIDYNKPDRLAYIPPNSSKLYRTSTSTKIYISSSLSVDLRKPSRTNLYKSTD